jgi:cysteine desulfurase
MPRSPRRVSPEHSPPAKGKEAALAMTHSITSASATQCAGVGQVYLDYNATTPLDPRVLDAMLPWLSEHCANPASAHAPGQRAALAIDEARQQVADLVGAAPTEIVFTSGATESINLALKGVADTLGRRPHLTVVATEHRAVLDTADYLARSEARVDQLHVDEQGVVRLDELKQSLADGAQLVAVMAANNETGTIAPLSEIAAACQEHGALLHCDATQLVGKLPFDVDALSLDFVSFSAHKFYGPKGAGALFIRRSRRGAISPLLHGGGQEHGYRSGTLNVPAIVGLGAAAQLAQAEMMRDEVQVSRLRDRLYESLRQSISRVGLNGHPTARLPGTLNVRIANTDAEVVLANMPDIAASTGSACSSAMPQPSHVLLAMGLTVEEAASSIRFSLGRFTSEDDVSCASEQAAVAVQKARSGSGE